MTMWKTLIGSHQRIWEWEKAEHLGHLRTRENGKTDRVVLAMIEELPGRTTSLFSVSRGQGSRDVYVGATRVVGHGFWLGCPTHWDRICVWIEEFR